MSQFKNRCQVKNTLPKPTRVNIFKGPVFVFHFSCILFIHPILINTSWDGFATILRPLWNFPLHSHSKKQLHCQGLKYLGKPCHVPVLNKSADGLWSEWVIIFIIRYLHCIFESHYCLSLAFSVLEMTSIHLDVYTKTNIYSAWVYPSLCFLSALTPRWRAPGSHTVWTSSGDWNPVGTAPPQVASPPVCSCFWFLAAFP